MGAGGDAPDVFSGLRESPIEVAFLMTETGHLQVGWSRREVRQEVLTVMAATLVSSVETIAETVGLETPRSTTVVTEQCHILARRVARDTILVLIAPRNVPRHQLDPIANRLAERIAPSVREPTRGSVRALR